MDWQTKIKKFLEAETQKTIEDDNSNLIDKGILDSFSMFKLIDFIQKELKISVKVEELAAENFNSISNIVKTLEKWK